MDPNHPTDMLVMALASLAAHNVAHEDAPHPSPCFECETQKLLSRCVQYGSGLLYRERTGA